MGASLARWAAVAVLKTLAQGPHSAQSGEKKSGPAFSEAAGRVRGRYVINLHEAERRDRGSLGYADEEGGYHGPNYRELF